jgi:hypothetical protein
MREIDSGLQAGLEAGNIVDRGMVLFALPSGNYGFWTGVGPWTYNGILWQGAGTLIQAQPVGQVTDGSAVPIVLTLSAIPNSALSPDVLSTIEAEAYKGAPVRLYKAYFDPDTRALITVRTVWAGTIDTIDHDYTIGGTYTLTANCESRALDHQKTGYRIRSDADQRLIDANDGFFKRVGVAGTQSITWGKAA